MPLQCPPVVPHRRNYRRLHPNKQANSMSAAPVFLAYTHVKFPTTVSKTVAKNPPPGEIISALHHRATMDKVSSFCHVRGVWKPQAEEWMSLSTHLAELSEKHKSLERKIAEQIARPNADELELMRLKREKLKLKDRMTELKT
jgi:hypothetical protein